MERNRIYIETLPSHILKEILLFLDIKSILRFNSLSRTLLKNYDDNLWKQLSLRDHLHYLANDPCEDSEMTFPKSVNEIENIKENVFEANKVINNPFDDLLTTMELENIEKNRSNIKNWREFYIEHSLKPNFSGYFVGEYGAHGFELIRIYHKGYKIFAKKVTGDPNIPAGKITWKGILNKNLTKIKGFIHLAKTGYMESWWSNCVVEVKDKNTFATSWFVGEYMPGFLLVSEFYTVRGGYEPSGNPNSLRKTYLIPLQEA